MQSRIARHKRSIFLSAAALAGVALGVQVFAATPIGTAKNVVNKVYGNSVTKTIRTGDALIQNQRVRTGRASSTDIRFKDDTKLLVGELSDITLDQMLYNPNQGKVTGALQLARGILRFASVPSVKMDVKVKTPHALLGIRGTAFDVLATSRGMELAVHEGAVQVDSQAGGQLVSAGQVYRVSAAQFAGFAPEPSAEMQQAVDKMVSMVGTAGVSTTKSQSTAAAAPAKTSSSNSSSQVASLPKPSDATIQKVLQGKNRNNVLLLELSHGTAVIEMLPNAAPNHVKRIRQLVRQKFYDGQAFHNVKAGFAAETGDPTGTGRGGSGTKLQAEFSSQPFVRGTVGMKRSRNDPNSADSQFFITLGNARHLNGKYTVWGRVIHGMELIDRLRKGSPPANPDSIKGLSVAADSVKSN